MTQEEIVQVLRHEKLSQRIRRALTALKKSEQPDALIKPKMDVWHWRPREELCFACLGGLATIDLCDAWEIRPARTSEIAELVSDHHDGSVNYGVISSALDTYECSLNSARLGNIGFALGYVIGDEEARETGLVTMEVPSYTLDPIGFKDKMLEMAELLEERDL